MKKTFQLGLLFLGALALSFTLATAEGKCSGDKKEMKCQSGKCAAGKCGKDGMKGAMKKEMNATKPTEKTAPAKGKCGVGKCG